MRLLGSFFRRPAPRQVASCIRVRLAQTLTIAALIVASACDADESQSTSASLNTNALITTTTTTIPFADFVEMFYKMPVDQLDLLTPDKRPEGHDIPDDVVHGILEIAGPCAYIHQLQTWVDGGLHRDASGVVQSYLLALPYNLTHYDPSTQSLWVEQQGPMVNGDKVTAVGRIPEHAVPSEHCPLAFGRQLRGSLIPGLSEILCRGDGAGISGWMPGAGESQPCV